MVTTGDLNRHAEECCTGATQDKKYFEAGNAFIKRTLRRHEWPTNSIGWRPSAALPQRWKTDAAIITYLREHTNIPVPRLLFAYEDDGAFTFSTELVSGVNMTSLTDAQKAVVTVELQQHIATLKALRSKTPGVPGETLLCAPMRVHTRFWKSHSCWRPKAGLQDRNEEEYVFCHNDLGQHNILVHPETLKITAVLDWEYGGFYPAWFEQPYWTRPGPSAPLDGEEDDRERCRQWLFEHCDEVVMPHLLSFTEKMEAEEKMAKE
ncbi:hypothetical protein SCUCBS95973_007373 [Sporothrix curviconia]|uniref:Aminoglycoside phosphotransferase domain-containing protein n=1 Tax=Sporothrix curviconia TaxID=1260050 RepID=A0ABP0CCT2_9PEZI